MRGKAKLEGIITAAQTYAQARTWTAAGDLLDSEITRVLTERNAGPNVEREGAHPVTIPRAIPPEESAPSEPPVPMQLAPQEVTDEPPQ